MEPTTAMTSKTSESGPSKRVIVAGAQLGPIHVSSTRANALGRMLKLMDEARSKNVKLLVYPEIAFVTFFPRHLINDDEQLEAYFERDVDGDPAKAPNMKPIFDKARQYGMDVSIGYAECDTSAPSGEHVHYNTAVYYSAAADKVIHKYRKVHLPGTFEPYERKDATNQLEKRYFRPGNLGFVLPASSKALSRKAQARTKTKSTALAEGIQLLAS
jgi:predicted amidohydrolase